jgi:hypothetical protein
VSNYCITTVTVAATNFDLTTLDDVRTDLNITGTDEDDFLERAITKSSAAIASYCNRVFPVQTYQDLIRPTRDSYPFFPPHGGQPIMVVKTPLVTVTSITENDVILVSGTDFEKDIETGAIYRLDGSGHRSSWPSQKVVIVYTAGYSTIPADVEDACVRMVRNARTIHKRPSGLKAVDIPGVARQEFWVSADGGNLTQDIMDILSSYRIPVLG